MSSHRPGLRLSGDFYAQAVHPLVANVAHTACLIGEGSEVLGFDTERSTDHAWGLRLQVFVAEDDVGDVRAAVDAGLPGDFDGWPVRYYRWQTQRVDHHVEVSTTRGWLMDWLKFDPRDGMSTARWLATPQQLLLEVTAGKVFHDGLGDLSTVRDLLAWYPQDLWLWLMACEWSRVAQYEPLVGRTAEVGDDVGSAIAAASVARHVIRLCLLQERRYAPYAKWLGSALRQHHPELATTLAAAVHANEYARREELLGKAYLEVARRHNALRVTDHVEEALGPYDVRIGGAFRPFLVLNATRFAEALQHALAGNELTRLGMVGSIDQLMTPTDEIIHFTDWSGRIAGIYGDTLAGNA